MPAKLSEYKAKRDFSRTAEPNGSLKVRPSKVGRFVIQKHAATRLHYDLRLELDGVFKSWAVTKGPSLNTRDRRLPSKSKTTRSTMATSKGPFPRASMAAALCSYGIEAIGSQWATGRRKSSSGAASWTSSLKANGFTVAGS